MKKLHELSINPEKVIKNEELVNLKGGVVDPDCIFCMVYWYDGGSQGGWACGCGSSEQCEQQIGDNVGGAAYLVIC